MSNRFVVLTAMISTVLVACAAAGQRAVMVETALPIIEAPSPMATPRPVKPASRPKIPIPKPDKPPQSKAQPQAPGPLE